MESIKNTLAEDYDNDINASNVLSNETFQENVSNAIYTSLIPQSSGIINKPIENYYENNSRLMYDILEMSEEEYFAQEEKRINPLKGKNKNIETIYEIILPENIEFNSGIKINNFDKSVLDAIYTLYKADISCFTYNKLSKVIKHDENYRMSDSFKKKIEASIDKMCLLRIKINFEKEFKARKIDNIIVSGQKENFLDIKQVYLPAKGKVNKVEGLFVQSVPIAWAYAEAIKQIIAIPSDVYTLTKPDSNEQHYTDLHKSTLSRIEKMKNENNYYKTRKIAYGGEPHNEGIFGEIGVYSKDYSNWNKKKINLRNSLKKILDNCVSLNYIYSYYEYKASGRSYLGVRIFLMSDYKKMEEALYQLIQSGYNLNKPIEYGGIVDDDGLLNQLDYNKKDCFNGDEWFEIRTNVIFIIHSILDSFVEKNLISRYEEEFNHGFVNSITLIK